MGSSGCVCSDILILLLLFMIFFPLLYPLLLSLSTCLNKISQQSQSIQPLDPLNVVRGQYRGYRQENGVAPDSQVETFATVKLSIDSWRWADVPFYIRAGKNLPVTATEILVELKGPPQAVFGEVEPGRSNY